MKMRDYLKTNEKAGWVRSGNIRALWNGVTEAENPRFLACNGVATNKYVTRETLRAAIQDDFCNLDLSRTWARQYNQNTMEHVIIQTRFFIQNPDGRVLSKEACVEYLLAGITDGCDGNDPTGNPANFKAGGTASFNTAGGHIQYVINPQAVRQPATQGPERGNGCDCSSLPWIRNDFTVWGHGWLSGDFGQALQDQVKEKCHLWDNSWRFDYGLGDDGREWTAWFRTDPSQQACVQWVAKAVGAHEDFICQGC